MSGPLLISAALCFLFGFNFMFYFVDFLISFLLFPECHPNVFHLCLIVSSSLVLFVSNTAVFRFVQEFKLGSLDWSACSN